MRKIFLIFVFGLVFFSCKQEYKKSAELKVASENTALLKDSLNEVKTLNATTKSSDTTSQKYDENLFDKKMVGLALVSENEKDVYKKYEIDFYHLCYGPAYSFYIDTNKNEIYIYEYDENDIKITNEILRYVFNIDKIKISDKGYAIECNSKIKVNDNGSFNAIELNNKIELNLTKTDAVLYQLTLKKEENRKYFENELRYSMYTNKLNERKFIRHDCGDFDG